MMWSKEHRTCVACGQAGSQRSKQRMWAEPRITCLLKFPTSTSLPRPSPGECLKVERPGGLKESLSSWLQKWGRKGLPQPTSLSFPLSELSGPTPRSTGCGQSSNCRGLICMHADGFSGSNHQNVCSASSLPESSGQKFQERFLMYFWSCGLA